MSWGRVMSSCDRAVTWTCSADDDGTAAGSDAPSALIDNPDCWLSLVRATEAHLDPPSPLEQSLEPCNQFRLSYANGKAYWDEGTAQRCIRFRFERLDLSNKDLQSHNPQFVVPQASLWRQSRIRRGWATNLFGVKGHS